MLEKPAFGTLRDGSRYPVDVLIFPDEMTGAYQWEVNYYPTNTAYASSYASSIETAYADALAVIEQGAVCSLDARSVTCYNTLIVTEGTQRSTLFREVERGCWVGFHAGQQIEVTTTDKYKVPHLTARRIYEVETARET